MIRVYLLLQVILGPLVAYANVVFVNFTVDDRDPNIRYLGGWNHGNGIELASPLNYGGSHSLSDDVSAIASFTFTGVSVYYLASLWPYRVDSSIALDGGVETLVNLTAPSGTVRPSNVSIGDEVVNYDVRWSAAGLENGTHTITIRRGSSTFAVVDAFIYTTAHIEDTTTSDSTSTSNPAETTIPSRASSSHLSTKTTVIIAVSVSILAVLLAAVFCLFSLGGRRRKSTRHSAALTATPRGSSAVPTSVTTPRTGRSPIHSAHVEGNANPHYTTVAWPGYEPVPLTASKPQYPSYYSVPTAPVSAFLPRDASTSSWNYTAGYNNSQLAGSPGRQMYSMYSMSSTSTIPPPSVQDTMPATRTPPSQPYKVTPMTNQTPSSQPSTSSKATPMIYQADSLQPIVSSKATPAAYRTDSSQPLISSKATPTAYRADSSQPSTSSSAMLAPPNRLEDSRAGAHSVPPPYAAHLPHG
ncbi:hypothetical protein FRC17_010662 [Serendipita sp. 399]|nr:hypothetical protein FRC17_010662 [Serendipita sp. 399]